MTCPEVKLGDDGAQFSVEGNQIVTAQLDDVVRLYHVAFGSIADSNDHEFWLIERSQDILVIPEDTAGFVTQLLPLWKRKLEATHRIFKIRCTQPPLSWVRKVLFIPPSTSFSRRTLKRPCPRLPILG